MSRRILHMPDPFRVIISSEAIEDLRGIFEFIDADSPQNADHVVARLLAGIESLAQFPSRRPVVRQSRRQLGYEVRALIVFRFKVFYRIVPETRTVRVLTVRHGSQRPWP